MERLISTTVRLEKEDVQALKRARADGLSASELLRKGLRVVASRYYSADGRLQPFRLNSPTPNLVMSPNSFGTSKFNPAGHCPAALAVQAARLPCSDN